MVRAHPTLRVRLVHNGGACHTGCARSSLRIPDTDACHRHWRVCQPLSLWTDEIPSGHLLFAYTILVGPRERVQLADARPAPAVPRGVRRLSVLLWHFFEPAGAPHRPARRLRRAAELRDRPQGPCLLAGHAQYFRLHWYSDAVEGGGWLGTGPSDEPAVPDEESGPCRAAL